MNIGSYLLKYGAAFILTISLEALAAVLLSWRTGEKLRAVLYVNLVTHPLLNLIILCLSVAGVTISSTSILVYCLEVLVVLVETLLYSKLLGLPIKKCWWRALTYNALSYGVGLVLFS